MKSHTKLSIYAQLQARYNVFIIYHEIEKGQLTAFITFIYQLPNDVEK